MEVGLAASSFEHQYRSTSDPVVPSGHITSTNVFAGCDRPKLDPPVADR